MQIHNDTLQQLARATLQIEAHAIQQLITRIDKHFVHACHYMLACKGRIIVLGIGKSGHIGGKIAATLASTGTPAFFVHPAEASHGDLGMITTHDVVLALSNSGKTEEILTLLPLIKRLGVPLIALTGHPDAVLSKAADVHIDISVDQEACPLGLAPTSSTTATLAMGDALAVALLEARGFTAEDFARSHPGGCLGRRLLLLVDDVMHTGEQIPRNTPGDLLKTVLLEMSHKGLGITIITDRTEHILGVFTDGDLRRALDQPVNIHTTRIADIMTSNCKTIPVGALAAEALQIMQQRKINALPVIDHETKLAGVLNMHDLLRAGVL
ncbi:MAG: D-arabinose 5-phosphate isomerase [Candidatus Contendobacter odensis]|uniref:Arabinose 5-phosphate isomerase n=1 Tax=Candidatus Contendibacter odensensis TaxID=1400860 RepID=A0A2G6PHE1_9GAMM|nr:MAG: D-arabinose 5-phosphate isomerase [Candidatus Contendobacter odensis]